MEERIAMEIRLLAEETAKLKQVSKPETKREA